MGLFSRQSTIPPQFTRTEALRCIPEKAAAASWRSLEDGGLLIEYPLAVRPFFRQLARRFYRGEKLPVPTRKLQLDRLGGAVWQLVDGKRNVGQIVKEFAAASGLTLQEAELSVTAFFRQLGRRGLIFLR